MDLRIDQFLRLLLYDELPARIIEHVSFLRKSGSGPRYVFSDSVE